MQPSIMIIDPDVGSAQTTQAGILRGLPGVTTTIATQLDRNWPNATDPRPDVVIIDPSPYSLNGMRLIQRLHEFSPGPAIVVLASTPTLALRQMVRELDVDVYLEKPTSLPTLLAHLNQLLGRQRPPAVVPADYAYVPPGAMSKTK
jgi:DNA-binding response OmpR family regulator